MKVAYLINQYPKVSHSFIRREIAALERQGVEVVRLAARGWDAEVVDPEDVAEQARTRYLLQDGLAPLLLALLVGLWREPGRWFKALGLAWKLGRRADRPFPVHLVYLAQACRLRMWLRGSGVGHVHAHFGTNPAEVALLLHALGGPPFSFTVHGPEEFDKPQALHLGDKLHHAAFVVAISAYGRSQLWRWADHADWAKVQEVHCGLEASDLMQEPSPVPDGPRLVCIGRLCEQKGQMLLLDALALLRERGVACELVLAGDGEMRQPITQRIQALNLADRVRITGWISAQQVRQELAAARALVLPSFAEGLPVVLMEAMAAGRPVLTTWIAGVPELVRSGVDGWLFAPGDVQALADAMQACLVASPQTLGAMGAAAHERVKLRHHVDVEAASLLRCFESAGRAAA